MALAKREIYKGVGLPNTVKHCRWMLRQLIDKLEIQQTQLSGPGDNAGIGLVVEQMLRVPKVT